MYFLRGDCARTEPGSDRRCLTPSVGNLKTNLLALTVGKFDDSLERSHLRVFPETAVFGGNATLRCNGGRLNHCETRASLDDSTQVGHLPVSVVAIFGRILTQRGQHNAVLEGGVPNL